MHNMNDTQAVYLCLAEVKIIFKALKYSLACYYRFKKIMFGNGAISGAQSNCHFMLAYAYCICIALSAINLGPKNHIMEYKAI